MCYPFKFALISFGCDMLAQAKWFQAGLISHFFVFQWLVSIISLKETNEMRCQTKLKPFDLGPG